MKALSVRREPTPADRRRVAVARERVANHLTGMLDGLDAETRIETCRAGIRALCTGRVINVVGNHKAIRQALAKQAKGVKGVETTSAFESMFGGQAFRDLFGTGRRP